MNTRNENQSYTHALQRFCDAVTQEATEVSIYTNNYYGVHAQVLETIYAVVKLFLGEKFFTALAYSYAKHYPSSQWDINLYGASFADFVAAQTQSDKALDADWQQAATLARIEYAISQAYYDDDKTDATTARWVHPIGPALDPKWVCDLQKQHPYLQTELNLKLNQAMAVWRADLKIQLSNRYLQR